MTKKKPQHGYLLTKIPNTQEGLMFVAQFRSFLNKDTYSMKLRGGGPRKEAALKDGLSARGYDREIPLDKAEYFRLYIERKP
tara:strand:+ start:457 stop:702 length:246 start_codon:yes stop_codon:yes gene_type:complete